MSSAVEQGPVVEVDGHDLPVSCPGPHTPLWSLHPKVFLDMSTGQAKCPYCGTDYRLKPGSKVHAH
ncbi:MAG: zinc-finger domain-containing protein [Burkholderiaceae bacterium]